MNNRESFLQLVRLGIRTTNRFDVPSKIDWPTIQALAERHGLYAIVLDGIEKLPLTSRPPQDLLLEWIGEVLKGYEYRYDQYCKTISEMATFYNSHGFKMMVVKGYACSLDWPRSEHRPCGDIDIWLFDKQKEADNVLAREKNIKIDSSHHHHTVYEWHDFVVENHYDFINTYDYRSSREIEQILKDVGKDDSHWVELRDSSTGSATKVYLPSPNLHALFLIRHNMAHFTSTSISLRQVLDWAFFVDKHSKEIDWKWLNEMLERFHMTDFYNCVNAICVEDLGFETALFPDIQFKPFLKEKVLNDIIYPEFEEAEPERFIHRIMYKYKRWKGNAWKRALCYTESDWRSFGNGIWYHLLKPSSI